MDNYPVTHQKKIKKINALLQTWHWLRLAVLHSIWTAARVVASSTHGLAAAQASPLPSHSHLASRLALKTITSMIRHDWVKCNDDVRQISGVCSSWLRGRDPSMTLFLFSFLFFCGLQDSCPFLSSKRAFRTPDEPEVRRNNGRVCMQQAFSPPQMIPMMGQSVFGCFLGGYACFSRVRT